MVLWVWLVLPVPMVPKDPQDLPDSPAHQVSLDSPVPLLDPQDVMARWGHPDPLDTKDLPEISDLLDLPEHPDCPVPQHRLVECPHAHLSAFTPASRLAHQHVATAVRRDPTSCNKNNTITTTTAFFILLFRRVVVAFITPLSE